MIEAFKVKQCKHVAIIMDGNGRWAQSRAHRRVWGHVRGSGIVSDIVESADDMGVDSLTLYAFSTENWSRPAIEVKTLFKLFKKFLIKERPRILKNNIRFRIIGDISKLPQGTQDLVRELERESGLNTGLNLTFAFGYGGRSEITSAVQRLVVNGEEITEENISKNMFAPDIGDVDLLIRTGGDHRISNFLLWQAAYAELFFTDTMWPEFSREEFESILYQVDNRERRFGCVSKTLTLNESQILAQENLLSF